MKISIITATWNSSATLRYTMRSVLSQSYPNIEHIIVDGGSTDSTMEIVHELEPEYQGKLRYISGKDKGIYDAMNKGIAMATGDIIGILNSDDFYTSDIVLSTVASAFKDGNIDAVYGDIHYVQDNDLQNVPVITPRNFSSPLDASRLYARPSEFLLPQEIYERYGGFNLSYKIAADFECLLRLIFVHKIRLRYIPMDFVTMRTGGASTSGLSSHKQILRDHQRAFKDNGIYSNVLLESLRYIYKIYEIIETKVSRNNTSQI